MSSASQRRASEKRYRGRQRKPLKKRSLARWARSQRPRRSARPARAPNDRLQALAVCVSGERSDHPSRRLSHVAELFIRRRFSAQYFLEHRHKPRDVAAIESEAVLALSEL